MAIVLFYFLRLYRQEKKPKKQTKTASVFHTLSVLISMRLYFKNEKVTDSFAFYASDLVQKACD